MNEYELNKYIGSKIREIRLKKRLTQKQLGEKIGVKHNTISSYENGTNSLQQDMLFKLSRALECKVDDFFPASNIDIADNLERALVMTNNLKVKDIQFLKKLIEKTLSLSEKEREVFLNSIKFTVEYYNKMNE